MKVNRLGKSQLLAWERFVTTQSKLLRLIESALLKSKVALPLHWYDVLLVLKRSEKGRVRLSEIANEIITSRSALSRSLEKLERNGYIYREEAAEDGRGQYAVITDKGRKAQKRTWVYYEAAIQHFFGAKLSSEEARQLAQILTKLGANEKWK